MKEISLRELLEAGCHFGHQTTRWNPKMRPFIFTARDRIHVFDLVKTKEGLEEAVASLKTIVSQNGKVLFVGTKRQAQDIVKEAAQKVAMPYMTHRWVGGFLTNWDQMKKRLDYLADLKDGKITGRFSKRTKKENLLIDREINKMELSFGGVAGLQSLPAAIFVADARKDTAALKEAKNKSVVSIAIVDTNADPDLVNIVIPANDDAVKSIQLIVDILVEAIEEGKKNPLQGKQELRIKNEEPKIKDEEGKGVKEELKEEKQGKTKKKEEQKAKSVKPKTTVKSLKPKITKKKDKK